MSFENRGIPAGFIASSEFVDAAKAQSQSLGVEPAGVFVQHPIQDRTDQEMVQLAAQAIDRIISLIADI